eukprot:s1_g157.t1
MPPISEPGDRGAPPLLDRIMNVVILGDSLGDGLWAGLYRELKSDPRFNIIKRSKVSTGFVRKDYFDWNAEVERVLAEEQVDIAVIMIGTNDRQVLVDDQGRRHRLRAPGWEAAYKARVDRFTRSLTDEGVLVYWVGLPVMRSPRFGGDMRYFNTIYEERAAANGVPFIPTWNDLADAAGAYQAYGPDTNGRRRLLRADDGIHFTLAGYRVLASVVADDLVRDRDAGILPGQAITHQRSAVEQPTSLDQEPLEPASGAANLRSTSSEDISPVVASSVEAEAGDTPDLRPGRADDWRCTSEPCDPTLPADPELSSFYDRLYALESGIGSDKLHILHLGDSHIAGDRFSGSLQKRFAARFGDAGRGQLPAGSPFPYYRRQGISVEASEGWTVFSSLSGPGVGPFGISGFRTEAASDQEWMRLTIDQGGPLHTVMLNMLQQPGGGSFSLIVDDVTRGSFQTNGATPRLMQVSVNVGAGSSMFLRAQGDGPVAILGWGGEGRGPGIVYEAHGIPGATLRVMDAWDTHIVTTELEGMRPDLIILGYGTNEGFDDALDVDLYRAHLENQVRRLKATLPETTILLIGAFDGARLPDWAELRPSSQAATRAALPCETLALHERATYRSLSADRDPVLGRWHAPPNLEAVRDVQRAVARSEGLMFWDGAAAMGGACGIHDFVFQDPPLAYGDHVHLTPAGADIMAQKLWDRLIRPYESLVCRRRLAA